MKQIETKPKEPYEAPVVLDIPPVTINVAEGLESNGEPENPIDDEG